MSSSLIEMLAANIDRRLGLSRPGRKVANKVFPHHWSFLLGEVALFSFVILVATGLFLTMFYRPSVDHVTYTGAAALYDGQSLPAAYESLVRLSHDVPTGELFRRLHRVAAHIFVASVVLHAARVFLTGAFRRPREVNYVVGVVLLVLALGAGFTGQVLPYDVIAGVTLRITHSFLVSIPYVGPQVAFWVFGGEFLAPDVLPRMFVVHVLIIPAAIAGVVAVHLALLVRQKHTQRPHRGIDGQRWVVGTPMWPWQFVASTGLVLAVTFTMLVASVLVPWSRTALHGPHITAHASNAAQPDWFLMWVEGALRIIPAFEVNLLGTVVSQPFVAGILLPAVTIGGLLVYPFLERRRYPVRGSQHVLQHPLDVPLRTAVFAAAAVGLTVLTGAAANDYLARLVGLPVEVVMWLFRVGVVVLPPGAGLAAYRYASRTPGRWAGPHPAAPGEAG